MAAKSVEAFVAFDEDRGIVIESISKTAFAAAQSLSSKELLDPTDQMLRMMNGKLKIHRISVEVLDAVDPTPPKKV